MNVTLALRIIAVVAFLLAAAAAPHYPTLIAAGLAFLAASFLAPAPRP